MTTYKLPDRDVVMYARRGCGYCDAAAALLDERGIDYEHIDVTGDDAARRWLREVTGRHTVPQIFIKGRSIGGFTELSALDRSGELARLLSSSQ
ncbi:MAG: glutaredoxin [Deltaproteobacteria bacterium]|nr:MAG: glutaredoxin [Deltaproteobacteria bacterium]